MSSDKKTNSINHTRPTNVTTKTHRRYFIKYPILGGFIYNIWLVTDKNITRKYKPYLLPAVTSTHVKKVFSQSNTFISVGIKFISLEPICTVPVTSRDLYTCEERFLTAEQLYQCTILFMSHAPICTVPVTSRDLYTCEERLFAVEHLYQCAMIPIHHVLELSLITEGLKHFVYTVTSIQRCL